MYLRFLIKNYIFDSSYFFVVIISSGLKKDKSMKAVLLSLFTLCVVASAAYPITQGHPRFILATAIPPPASTTSPASTSSALEKSESLTPTAAQLLLLGATAIGRSIHLHGVYTSAMQWFERFSGGKKRRDEIWEEYKQERDMILEKFNQFSSTVRITDLRSEYRRKYPAWRALWA
jgi:hypothetical protein